MHPPVRLDVPSPRLVGALTTSIVRPGSFFPSSSLAVLAMFQGAGAFLMLSVPEEQSHSSCNVFSLSPQFLTQIPSPFKCIQVCLLMSEEL